jgi:outer membrane protein assembly factor BamB
LAYCCVNNGRHRLAEPAWHSYTASPVLDEGKLYALTDSSMLSVFDAKTGTRTAFAAT